MARKGGQPQHRPATEERARHEVAALTDAEPRVRERLNNLAIALDCAFVQLSALRHDLGVAERLGTKRQTGV